MNLRVLVYGNVTQGPLPAMIYTVYIASGLHLGGGGGVGKLIQYHVITQGDLVSEMKAIEMLHNCYLNNVFRIKIYKLNYINA